MKSFLFLLGLVSRIYAFYPSTSDVTELTPANFDRLVLQSEAVWIVEFYAPWCGHCQQLVPEYEKTAKALKGIIKVGSVNADEHKSLASQYGVRGFPTIKIFGGNKKAPTDYAGERTAKALAEAGLAEANKQVKQRLGGRDKSGSSSSSTEVIELTDSNFDKLVLNSDDIWLVEFFAPWCGHCKNLAPHWEKAAAELKGKVKLGALDATSNTLKAQQYGIQGYPTIKYFPKGSSSSSDALEYDGGRTAESIISWALAKHVENVPAPEVVQIVNEKSFHSNCEGKPLCVVSVLPHILDCNAECRNTYLNILQELGEKYKSKMWGWIWAEGGTQHDLENSLEIGGFGYPAMAVVNFKKMKYSTLKGAFSRDGINDFLRDISFGRGQTAPVKGATIPKIYSIDPWDGKDGELPAEEEVDLSDIDLNDKDEL